MHAVIANVEGRSSEKFKLPRILSTGFSSDKMLAVFRNWKNKNTQQDVERVKRLLKEKLSIDNHVTLE